MTSNDLTGKVQTVLGPVDPGQLGRTLTHEHILFDGSWVWPRFPGASDQAFFEKPVSQETLGRIRHRFKLNRDNGRLEDVDTAIEEVGLYKQYGGGTLVEVTSIGIGRDPVGLARVSNATGVNIVMGGSFYVDTHHPPEMDGLAEDDIVELIVGDITEGAQGTSIKTGIIGEVGCSWPLAENERKALRASARAQRMTGAPLLIHPGRDETAPLEIIDILDRAGADLSHTVMGHLDRTVFERETLKQIAEAGCYMEWDLFGWVGSYYAANPDIDMPSDDQRLERIAWISSEGYAGKVVVAHDICTKHRLEKYGGHGYSYILDHIAPRMLTRGFTPEGVHDILVTNPAEALTFR